MIDGAAILADLADRNVLRLSHGLPLIDIETEYARLVFIERQREYHAACQEHAAEREAIRHQVLGDRSPPDTWLGRWALGHKARTQFTAYMAERYGIHPPGHRSG
jgi:hypothetical protein